MEMEMSKIYEVFVYEDDGCFMAETSAICINTNIPEIADTPVEFYDNTRAGVINQVLDVLKSRGLHGRLRVM
jgi:hypothetical protein